MLKKISITVLFATISCHILLAQSGSTNIWDITNQFLIQNQERDVSASRYPVIANGRIVLYPYFIFSDDGEINDPRYTIPHSKVLNSFSFGILGAHIPMHLLFTKNGKYFVINMKKPLLDIISNAKEACVSLGLNERDSFVIFSEALRHYQLDIKNSGGVPIQFNEEFLEEDL